MPTPNWPHLFFEPWNHHHWIRNFVLPQKYVKNFAVAQKLWILRPFFKIFLLRKQLLIKIIKTFKNSDLYMNYTIFYTKHTYKWILCNGIYYYIWQYRETHTHFFSLAPPFSGPLGQTCLCTFFVLFVLLYFCNLFGLSIRTSMQNLESVAQKMAELLH